MSKHKTGIRIAMIFRSLFVIIVLILSTISFVTSAQDIESDRQFYKEALESVIGNYHEQIKDQSPLLNGTQYAGYRFSFLENAHPFFDTNTASTGSVVYESILYPHVSLLFDELSELLILKDNSRNIVLNSEKVSGFTIGEYHFVNIQNQKNMKPGFYQVLSIGNQYLLKRERKIINEKVGEDVKRYLQVTKEFYLKEKENYLSFNTKKEVTNALEDNKVEIQKFIGKNSRLFKKDKEQFLISLCKYYETLY